MDLAYYVQKADSIFPIYGVTSLEEAKRFVDPEDHHRIVETAEPVYMNPLTGSVDFASGWDVEDIENSDLVMVEYDALEEAWTE